MTACMFGEKRQNIFIKETFATGYTCGGSSKPWDWVCSQWQGKRIFLGSECFTVSEEAEGEKALDIPIRFL